MRPLRVGRGAAAEGCSCQAPANPPQDLNSLGALTASLLEPSPDCDCRDRSCNDGHGRRGYRSRLRSGRERRARILNVVKWSAITGRVAVAALIAASVLAATACYGDGPRTGEASAEGATPIEDAATAAPQTPTTDARTATTEPVTPTTAAAARPDPAPSTIARSTTTTETPSADLSTAPSTTVQPTTTVPATTAPPTTTVPPTTTAPPTTTVHRPPPRHPRRPPRQSHRPRRRCRARRPPSVSWGRCRTRRGWE